MSQTPIHSGTSPNSTLLSRAFSSAMGWNIAEMLVAQLVTVGLYFFLATQIPLSVFGVFFIAAILADFIFFQGRSSAVDAIMQNKDFSQTTLSSAFWIMLVVVVMIAIGISLLSPVFAYIQGDATFMLFMPALAIILIPLPLGVPAQAKLKNELDFKGIALRGILAALAGGTAAVLTVLYTDAPEWALVVQRAVSTICSVTFLVWRARWLPGLKVRRDQSLRFLSDASRIFFAQGLHASIPRILVFMIGLSFGQAAVGAFEWARRLTEMIYAAVAAPMGSLWVIMFSRSDLNTQERKDLFRKLSTMSALICLPLFAGLALIASDLVAFALPETYGDIAPLLRILACIGLLSPLFYFRNAAFTALQKLDMLVGLAIVDVLVVLFTTFVSIFVLGLRLELVIAALVIQQIVTVLLFLPTLLLQMQTSLSQLVSIIAPGYVGTLAMAMAVFCVSAMTMNLAEPVRVGLKIATGGTVYAAFLACFHWRWLINSVEMIAPRTPTLQPS